jgi:hypothetical protein
VLPALIAAPPFLPFSPATYGSFGLDLRWARASPPRPASTSPLIEQHIVRTAPVSSLAFGPAVYAAYCFFPPLYLAGPIITFNSFSHQASPGSTGPTGARQPPLLPRPATFFLYSAAALDSSASTLPKHA